MAGPIYIYITIYIYIYIYIYSKAYGLLYRNRHHHHLTRDILSWMRVGVKPSGMPGCRGIKPG
ncbi:hypothetical protein N9L68_02595 [bacterium]|nr:hypothetical protein [bacterium]